MFGEGGVGDNVLHRALGVGGDEADAERRRGIERVGDADLPRLQAVLVHDVLLGGEHEPDGFIVEGRIVVGVVIVVSNEGLLGRCLFLLVLFRFDVPEEGRRSSGDLRKKKKVSYYSTA
jgi:hypothetical protein